MSVNVVNALVGKLRGGTSLDQLQQALHPKADVDVVVQQTGLPRPVVVSLLQDTAFLGRALAQAEQQAKALAGAGSDGSAQSAAARTKATSSGQPSTMNFRLEQLVKTTPTPRPIGAQQGQQLIDGVGGQFRQMPLITQGLAVQYSPNHTMTTAQHVIRQSEMLSHAFGGDYDALAQLVEHPNPALRASADEIKAVLAPLLEGLSRSDLKVLSVVAGIHDLGKVTREYARGAGLDLAGVDFIAHDYETDKLLRANPTILDRFKLSADERSLVLQISKLHSFPGQFAFGEGNLAAYEPFFEMKSPAAEQALKLARAQGVIDVMSALNETFVKFILPSHATLRNAVDNCLSSGISPADEFAAQAKAFLHPDTIVAAQAHGVGAVAAYRLLKLVGLKADKGEGAQLLTDALKGVDQSFISRFNRVTDTPDTWYGTYIFNAFGGSLVAATTAADPSIDAPTAQREAVRATVKMVATADAYRARFSSFEQEGAFAFSAHQPSLEVKAGGAQALAVLDATRELKTLDSALSQLATGGSPLTIRGNGYAVEIGWQGKGLDGVDGVRRAINGTEKDFRFYHIVNHLIDAGFDTEARRATGPTPKRYTQAFDATHPKGSFAIDGIKLKKVGQGEKGEVYEAADGTVYKAALRPVTCAMNEIEAAVAADLARQHGNYGIDTTPILAIGPDGAWLQKPLLDLDNLAGRVLARGPLSPQQTAALSNIFQSARRYAADTGISLDLTSDNLVWNAPQGRWAVLDAGPRTSAGPRKHTYTMGCESFDHYLKIWNKNFAAKST